MRSCLPTSSIAAIGGFRGFAHVRASPLRVLSGPAPFRNSETERATCAKCFNLPARPAGIQPCVARRPRSTSIKRRPRVAPYVDRAYVARSTDEGEAGMPLLRLRSSSRPGFANCEPDRGSLRGRGRALARKARQLVLKFYASLKPVFCHRKKRQKVGSWTPWDGCTVSGLRAGSGCP